MESVEERIQVLERKIENLNKKNSVCYDQSQKAIYDAKIKEARKEINKLKEKKLDEPQSILRIEDPVVGEKRNKFGVKSNSGTITPDKNRKNVFNIQI